MAVRVAMAAWVAAPTLLNRNPAYLTPQKV